MGEFKERLKYLLEQYSNNNLTSDETEEFTAILLDGNCEILVCEIMKDMFKEHQDTEEISGKEWELVLQRILNNKKTFLINKEIKGSEEKSLAYAYLINSYKRTGSIKWLALTACVLLVITTLYLFLGRKNDERPRVYSTNQSFVDQPVKPGGNKAYLTLSDGSVVHLDSMAKGTFTNQGNTMIVKKDDGQLEYIFSKTKEHTSVYNTLNVPRGGEYQLILSDGTKVWLNASSSLKYPTQFEEKERKVVLSGEGYFEVKRDEQHPFIVEAGEANIQVLGTKFNASAYANDTQNEVNLVEGTVRVEQRENKSRNVVLKPGYEAVLKGRESGIVVKKANLEVALAWKNGMFIFEEESLGNIMKKLSRWYNVDFEYENGVDTLYHFTGRIQKYERFSEILHLLELTKKVKFEANGGVVKVRLHERKTEK